MTDPRAGLPSASNSERYFHCTGSFLAGRGMPDNSTADSELGDRGHHALARWYQGDPEPLGKLPFAESETCLKCIQGVETVLGDLGASLFDGFLQPVTGSAKVAMVERRLWLTNGGDPAYADSTRRVGSGQADLVVMLLNQPAYVIFDFKLLYGQTSPAESNYQLRSLAALLRETLGDDKSTIYASIVAPNQSRVPSVVRYDYDASLVALRATVALFRSVLAGGPRTPGDHCRYCPALGTCPEAQARAVLDVAGTVPLGVSPEQRMGVIHGQNLSDFLNCVPRMEDVIAAAKAEAARRLNMDPESVPGFRMKPGNWKEQVSDIQQVFARFIQGASNDAERAHRTTLFMRAVRCVKGDLEEAQKAISGSKGQQLERELDRLLAGCTTKTQNKSSLERIKPLGVLESPRQCSPVCLATDFRSD